MQELEEAEVKAGRGIVGDRYFARKGTYSVFRDSNKQVGRREPGRQITLLAAEGVEEALQAANIPALATLGDFRRNIVLRGVPTSELQGAAGRTISIGQDCVVFVHRLVASVRSPLAAHSASPRHFVQHCAGLWPACARLMPRILARPDILSSTAVPKSSLL